jgi:hypothetical protein
LRFGEIEMEIKNGNVNEMMFVQEGHKFCTLQAMSEDGNLVINTELSYMDLLDLYNVSKDIIERFEEKIDDEKQLRLRTNEAIRAIRASLHFHVNTALHVYTGGWSASRLEYHKWSAKRLVNELKSFKNFGGLNFEFIERKLRELYYGGYMPENIYKEFTK